ncbi:RNA-binding domain-containing protein [Salinimicrobium sediminilitoris]|uniref:RNA-binding domain-containing protein n=1 Tax=Salinimicrobium sediminilitoris TaxID=2876715 RepID=UPI001E4D7783|nr:RNA-binding domain-containing protein [Salinimicrobium sediminilitoris]MCC8359499.1 putative DNA binding domain-containing protein [Salinimicrobium sediminilitoris]
MSARDFIENKLSELLSQNYENEIVEFKEAKNQYDFNKLGKYFSALSNEANLKGKKAAWLIFGIRDGDKAVVDTRFRLNESDLHSLKPEVANHTTNRITFKEIHEIKYEEGRVLMFEIPAAPQGLPIAWKGHYFGRDGEELQPLNLEELERIRLQAKQEDWSVGIIKSASISDLSEEAIQKARQSFKTKNPKLVEEIDFWSDETFLNKAKVTIKGKITRTAILLLGKPEAEHYVNPATSKITWILKDRDNLEKDYEHFTCPLILSAEKVYSKIRNLKYRYINDGSLFPEEVDQFDPYIIREALNNCIAHQDYTLGGRITVVENEEGSLIFSNQGRFIPNTVEDVVVTDAPESKYRNRFLADAMVNLNMIDTIGSGIKKMFIIQKRKYFPLPDYDISDEQVKVTITGKVVDLNYARKLATVKDLSLADIIALDKVAKGKKLNKGEIRDLKNKGLIEGRKPNFHIAASVAKVTGEKGDYIKQRGIDDGYCQKIILEYLKKFGEGKRTDFELILLDKLPDVLDISQKQNKIKNNLQKLRRQGIIEPFGKVWKMSKKY